jgi:hypothetical protein
MNKKHQSIAFLKKSATFVTPKRGRKKLHKTLRQ